MAKMTRNDLKSLVKECLFEILLESTVTDSSSQLREVRKNKGKQARPASRRPVIDNIATGQKSEAPAAVDMSEITSDPVMAAIFQDTARTTLVEQSRAESLGSRAGGDAASAAMAGADPQEVFGKAAQNWAALAFDD